jgi:peroxiredoxin
MMTNRLIPRQPVPDLTVKLLDGTNWLLSDQQPVNFTMLVFYRGLHCPICANYLKKLDSLIGDFAGRGVEVLALSSDSEERVRESKDKWGLENTLLGYGLSIDEGRRWGLFVSTPRKETEPPLFLEPGLFLIRPDMTLYASQISTMPFVRPDLEDLLDSINYILENDYPARGEA